MSESEKAAILLDEEERDEQDEQDKQTQGQPETITDPAEQLKKLCRGTLKLMFPFRAADRDVEELPFDLCALSGAEIASALDTVPVNNVFAVSNEQALAVFALSAGKCAPMIELEGGYRAKMYDAKDIKARISAVDTISAVRVTKLFYSASTRAGNKNILNG